MSPVFDDQGRVRAAGGIPWRRRAGGVEVLVAHRPRYDDWTFPKGKADEGEPDADCALREVEEEVGVLGVLGPELRGTVYTDKSGREKRVRYWAIEATGGEFSPNEEVDEVRWLPAREARRLLSYRHDRPVVDDLACLADAERGSPAVVVVRHADAGSPGSFAGPDSERPLTDKGRGQAASLAARLRLLPAGGVWSSPARRCQETAAVLAREWGLEVQVTDDLNERRFAEARALVRRAGDTVVLVSHGDVIPDVLDSLRPLVVNHVGEMVGDREPWPCAKASAWVLERGTDDWAARYIPATP